MVLLKEGDFERFDIPHEDGEWVSIKKLSWGDARDLRSGDDDDSADKFMAATLVAWSYDAEVTPENIDRLDVKTAMWIAEISTEVNGLDGDLGEESSGSLSSPSEDSEPGPQS